VTAALLALCLLQPPVIVPPRPLDRVRRGMSPDEVRQLLGPPPRVARQLLFGRYVEQWIYPAPVAGRVEFLFERATPPTVRAVRPTVPQAP
jgi:hypothetical protein